MSLFNLRSARLLGTVAACAGACLAAAPASAILVQPVLIRMQSSGTDASSAITVINDRNRTDTVEISVSKLKLAQQGSPELTKDPGSDFLIFPPVATIEPGKTQVFRIRWIGDPVLAEARTFMFTTSELPVDRGTGSGVQLVYAIQSLVTVSSPKLQPDLKIAGVQRSEQQATTKDGQPGEKTRGVTVTFQNDGNDVVFLSDFAARLSAGGATSWSREIANDEFAKFVGLGLIPPNSKRDIFLPVAEVPATGDIQLTLKQEKNKR